MKIHHGQATVKTEAPVSVQNVTEVVTREVGGSGITDGLAIVSVPHTTCGVCINEDEAGLREDIRDMAQRLLSPLRGAAGFRHDRVDNNAQAHLTSVLLGHSVSLSVKDGKLQMGGWQSVFLIEMDGPRSRTLHVQVLGE